MRRLFFFIGGSLVLCALFWPYLAKLGLGSLPGDLTIKRDGYTMSIPIVSCILVSIAISAIMAFFRRFR